MPRNYIGVAMYSLDFNRKEHVHFIGIGGISMSGLAEILLNEGFTVSGSDAKASDLTEHLKSLGADISIGQSAENINDSIDVVVYTAAVHPDNPEFAEAVRKNLKILKRAELLGEIMRNFPVSIGIAGTHGKTTTTSMCAEIFTKAGLDPTISVGGILPSIGGNIRIGNSDTFITEACEYTNSYHSLYPSIAVILNIDADHLDFFKDIDDIADSFNRYARLVPENGALVILRDSDKFDTVTKDITCRIVTFGSDRSADYYPENITYNEFGCASFTCMHNGKALYDFSLSVPGYHNVLNALACIAVSEICGIEAEKINSGLCTFTGADRRFQQKGKLGNITIVDDYAHHPSEISATLKAAENYPHRELWVAFQPHTYTRTKALLDDFAKALSLADHVLLADIYAAREKNTLGISSDDLREKISALGTDAKYFSSFAEIENYLSDNCVDNDLIITMGAGDIFRVGEHLLEKG